MAGDNLSKRFLMEAGLTELESSAQETYSWHAAECTEGYPYSFRFPKP